MAQIIYHELESVFNGKVGEKSAESTEKYVVITDEPLDNNLLILADPRTPKYGDPLQGAEGQRALEIRTNSDDMQTWEVFVDYSFEVGDEEAENPLARPAKITTRSIVKRELSQFDGEGRLLMTRAGEPMAPREIERKLKVFDIEKNIPPEYPEWMEDYDNVLNDGDFLLKDRTRRKGTLLAGDLVLPDPEFETISEGEKVWFIKMTLSLTWDPRGWTEKILHQGFHELFLRNIPTFNNDGTQGDPLEYYEYRRIKLDDGTFPAKPILLDANGSAFRDDEGKLRDVAGNLTSEEIVTIDFNPFKSKPFSVLPLE